MCILAKYEPACNIGTYEWDYKVDRNYSALSKLNRYLVELEDLKEFIGKYNNHYYVVAPLRAWNKINRKLKEKEFLKDNWNKIDFCKIQEEQKERFEPLENRVISYYTKELTQLTDFELIKESYWDWHNLYILVSKHEFNTDEINSIFSQIAYFNFSNLLLDYLILKNIGFINLEMSFFHEECSSLEEWRDEKGEKILMCYCPWKLTE